jgi:hypothetical protein
LMIAQDLLPQVAIARKLGVEEQTLSVWKRNGEFQTKVQLLRGEILNEMKDRGVRQKDLRISVLEDLHRGLMQIIDERREQYKKRRTAGVSTGLMRRVVKAIGSGAKAKVVRQFEIDTDLMDQLKSIQQQIAQERGEWKETSEQSQTVVFREYTGIDPDKDV